VASGVKQHLQRKGITTYTLSHNHIQAYSLLEADKVTLLLLISSEKSKLKKIVCVQ